MTNEHTLDRLHFAISGIKQLAAGAACDQLDMQKLRLRRTGKRPIAGPLGHLDRLAVNLAEPYLQALADVERDLTSAGSTPARK